MNTDWLDLVDFDVDDDPEILRAALDFIESCESSEGSDVGEGCVVDTPAMAMDLSANDAVATTTAAPARPNKRRNPRKEEIAELRKHVATLEQQLATTKRRQRVAPSHRLITSSGDDDSVDTSAIWEEIAKRQQKQRYLAELENVKLRNMVDNQLKIAGELTRVNKRQQFLHEYYEPMLTTTPGGTVTMNPSSTTTAMASLQSASPLLVTIFPSRRTRPSLPMAATAPPTEELPFEPWKPSLASEVVRGDRIHAVRIVAWKSMLRQWMSKRRLGYSYDRLNEIIDTAITPQHELPSGLDAGLVYTERYSDDDDKATRFATPAWNTGSMWQSPLSLVSALLSQQSSINLRMFTLPKPRPVEADGSRRAAPPSCLAQTAIDWRQRSKISQSLCLRVL